MRTALHGSPFGFIDGDTVRLSAMAERYTTTWRSADRIVSSAIVPWSVRIVGWWRGSGTTSSAFGGRWL